MLMNPMRRWNMVLVLVATIALAAQPILHNHSLIPTADGHSLSRSTIQCAFCATSNARPTVVVSQMAIPLEVAADYVDLTAPAAGADVCGDLSSRAPPAAA